MRRNGTYKMVNKATATNIIKAVPAAMTVYIQKLLEPVPVEETWAFV